jgi:hypothetical protein
MKIRPKSFRQKRSFVKSIPAAVVVAAANAAVVAVVVGVAAVVPVVVVAEVAGPDDCACRRSPTPWKIRLRKRGER